jgi:acetolactate synthase I/II/III large subunit
MDKIKVADFVANYLSNYGVKYIHILMGGGAATLNDSFCKHPKLKYVCYHLENYGSYAAFGEAKFSGKLAVFNSTSGIGAINTLPGILSAWGDGVPLLVIAGNTALKQTRRYLRLHNNIDVHHNGVQDNDIVENVKSITKYAVSLEKSEDIKYELEKCIYLATTGRPGPVLIEIPSDIAGSLIEVDKLKNYYNSGDFIQSNLERIKVISAECILKLKEDLQTYQRPLVLAGGGIRQSNTVNEFKQFIEKYQIPYINTFLSVDLLPYNHLLNLGTIGVKGKRNANFALQNADLLLILGCSLQTAHIGYLPDKFAYRAKKIMVDIDENSLNKNIIKIDTKIKCELGDFFRYMI